MKRAAIYSAILHILVLVILALGFHNPFRHSALVQQPIMIEVKNIRDISTAPKLAPEPVEEVKPQPTTPEKKPEPIKPEPVKPQPEPPKPPQPQPEPPKEQPIEKPAEVVEEKEPIPVPKAKPKPPEPPKEKPIPPRPRPKAEIDLSKKKAVESKEKEAKKKEAAFDELLDNVLKDTEKPTKATEGAPAAKVGDVMSASDLDALRRRIHKCWLVPAGARDAKNLIVDIDMEIAPDGRVKKAEVADKSRMDDSFYRAAAESAQRAVLDPKCNPLPLPPGKYEQWKNLTLSFNPKEMFN